MNTRFFTTDLRSRHTVDALTKAKEIFANCQSNNWLITREQYEESAKYSKVIAQFGNQAQMMSFANYLQEIIMNTKQYATHNYYCALENYFQGLCTASHGNKVQHREEVHSKLNIIADPATTLSAGLILKCV